MKMLSASVASREGQLVVYHIGLSVVSDKYMQIDLRGCAEGMLEQR